MCNVPDTIVQAGHEPSPTVPRLCANPLDHVISGRRALATAEGEPSRRAAVGKWSLLIVN